MSDVTLRCCDFSWCRKLKITMATSTLSALTTMMVRRCTLQTVWAPSTFGTFTSQMNQIAGVCSVCLWHMCASSYLCLSVGGWKRFESEFLLIYIKMCWPLFFGVCVVFSSVVGREGGGFFSLLLITCVSGCLFKMLNFFCAAFVRDWTLYHSLQEPELKASDFEFELFFSSFFFFFLHLSKMFTFL